MPHYFSLTIGANGASTAAYYSVTPTSNLTISQGGVSIAPTAASGVMVNVYPQTLQIQAPAGIMSGGVTIVTDESTVTGQVTISPPVDVPATLTLYGNGGHQLGQKVFDAGSNGGPFSFSASAAEAIPANDAQKELETLLSAK